MDTLTFKQQYEHPSWQRLRLTKMEAEEFRCERCGRGGIQLHVHHRRYVRGRMVWEYEHAELQVLCKDCHASVHNLRDILARLLQHVEICSYPGELVAIGLLAGYASVDDCASDAALLDEARAAAGPFFEAGVTAFAAELADGGLIAQSVRGFRARHGMLPNPPLEAVLARMEAPRIPANL